VRNKQYPCAEEQKRFLRRKEINEKFKLMNNKTSYGERRKGKKLVRVGREMSSDERGAIREKKKEDNG
jgi:hypothetical protein